MPPVGFLPRAVVEIYAITDKNLQASCYLNDNKNEKCYHLAIKWLEKASDFATFPAQEPGKTALG